MTKVSPVIAAEAAIQESLVSGAGSPVMRRILPGIWRSAVLGTGPVSSTGQALRRYDERRADVSKAPSSNAVIGGRCN